MYVCVWGWGRGSNPCHIDCWPLGVVGSRKHVHKVCVSPLQKSSVVRAASVMQVRTIGVVNSYRLVFTLYNSGNMVKLTHLNKWDVNELHGTEPSLTSWQFRSYYTYSSVNGSKSAAIWSDEPSISHCPVITWPATWLAAIYSRVATRFLS